MIGTALRSKRWQTGSACLLAFVAATAYVTADDPPAKTASPTAGDRPAATSSGLRQESWIGRRVDDLEATWGEPVKVRRTRHGRIVYKYRQELTLLQAFETPGLSYSDTGVGPGSRNSAGRRGTYVKETEIKGKKFSVTSDSGPFNPEVIPPGRDLVDIPVASRKATFWVDDRGVIVEEEIGEMKWKKGYGPTGREQP